MKEIKRPIKAYKIVLWLFEDLEMTFRGSKKRRKQLNFHFLSFQSF
jgi:hypothetical protein